MMPAGIEYDGSPAMWQVDWKCERMCCLSCDSSRSSSSESWLRGLMSERRGELYGQQRKTLKPVDLEVVLECGVGSDAPEFVHVNDDEGDERRLVDVSVQIGRAACRERGCQYV